jgi:hypothetical protein
MLIGWYAPFLPWALPSPSSSLVPPASPSSSSEVPTLSVCFQACDPPSFIQPEAFESIGAIYKQAYWIKQDVWLPELWRHYCWGWLNPAEGSDLVYSFSSLSICVSALGFLFVLWLATAHRRAAGNWIERFTWITAISVSSAAMLLAVLTESDVLTPDAVDAMCSSLFPRDLRAQGQLDALPSWYRELEVTTYCSNRL